MIYKFVVKIKESNNLNKKIYKVKVYIKKFLFRKNKNVEDKNIKGNISKQKKESLRNSKKGRLSKKMAKLIKRQEG